MTTAIAFTVLVVAFLWGSFTAVNAGLIAVVAAFVIGSLLADLSIDTVIAQFPADLFFILAGATLLFAIVRLTGTIDLLAHWAERAVGGRRGLVPVLMFLLTAVLASAGAFTPAAVAIVAPVALNLGARFGINRLAMGLVIVSGANAGAFSPVNPFGIVSNKILRDADADGSLQLYLNSFIFNAVLAVLGFLVVQTLLGRRAARAESPRSSRTGADEGTEGGTDALAAAVPGTGTGTSVADPGDVPPADARTATAVASRPVPDDGLDASAPVTLTPMRALTLAGLVALIVLTLVFEVDVGVAALAISLVLLAVRPGLQKGAIDSMPWSAILLVTGIVTYVGVLVEIGAIKALEDAIAGFGSGSLATLVTSYLVATVSAFASTTGTLAAISPAVVPLAADPALSAVGVVSAISIASSVVDISPMSTTGALLMANAEGNQERAFFRALLIWAILMIAVVPVVAWAVFVAL
ncbi:MAG: hypothetical protein QOE19_269 [Actinomycetota bacterium]|nr:hypothetical protein [Actinomycetota bacterium]